jgi:hypothetical protein
MKKQPWVRFFLKKSFTPADNALAVVLPETAHPEYQKILCGLNFHFYLFLSFIKVLRAL